MDAQQYHLLAQVEQRHWWHRVLRRAIRETLRRYHRKDRLRVLDAGCGTGGVSLDLRDQHDVTSFDISPLALSYARSQGLTKLARASVVALPFADRSFDAVISIDVISHHAVTSDLEALREARRVLAPGGLLLLQLSAFKWLAGEHDRAVRQDRYSRRQVVELLNRSGLKRVLTRYRLAFLPPLMVVNNLLASLRSEDAEPDLALPSAPVNALLHLAGRLDYRFGQPAPLGSSLWCVARRV